MNLDKIKKLKNIGIYEIVLNGVKYKLSHYNTNKYEKDILILRNESFKLYDLEKDELITDEELIKKIVKIFDEENMEIFEKYIQKRVE